MSSTYLPNDTCEKGINVLSRLDDALTGDKPLIMFLGDDVDEEDHSVLFPELRHRGVSVIRVHPAELSVTIEPMMTSLMVDHVRIHPQLVVGWVLKELLWQGMALLDVIQRCGIAVINDAMTLFRAQNKLTMSSLLHYATVPHYPAWYGSEESAARAWLEAGHLPGVSKPVRGFGGEGLTLLTESSDIEGAMSTPVSAEPSYLVPWVDNPGRDIRVYTVDHHAVFAMYRYAPDNGWVTNVRAGGSISHCPVTPELADVAEAASRAAGTVIGGVDIAETPAGFVVHEVNSCPTCEPPVLRVLADFLAATVKGETGPDQPWRPPHVHTETMPPQQAFHPSKAHRAV